MRKRANKKQKSKRDIFLKIRVSEEELEAFKRKFNNSGMKTFSGLLRAMILDGHIVHFNVDELREIYRLATNINCNINQILRHVDRDDDSFDSDIADIREKMHQIWQALIYFQCKNLQLKH